MKVDFIVVGDLGENCYLLEKNGCYLLVDPGEDLDRILKFISHKNILGILVTHCHFDHVASLKYLVSHFSYPVYCYDNLEEGAKKIGPFNMEVIFTPGHTKDSVSYYFRDEKIMITGDFLFCGTVGRCDLEGGSFNEMMKSIHKISKYDDDIVIYSGHGRKTTLGNEKKYNPYFKEG